MTFTTRPELKGTFGMVASTHWIASAVGMNLLERGGTAADAAAGMAFVLNVVEPHLNGPLGDMPALYRPAGEDSPVVYCGQGVAPAAATIERYRSEGLDIVPGSGLLATVVPGAFDALMLLMRDHGRLAPRDVLEPAIHYASKGHPLLPAAADVIAGLKDFFAEQWPTSAAVWTPGGDAPKPWSLLRNPELARFWTRILDEAEAGRGRVKRIEAARRAFREGFVAETIDDFMRRTSAMDATGVSRKGVLAGQDMAEWRATVERPLSTEHHGWTVWKCAEWTQGPAFLLALNMLRDFGLGDMDPNGAEFAHTVTETLKLAFADRDAYFGDSADAPAPISELLGDDFASARAALIGSDASLEQRPGHLAGHGELARRFIDRAARFAEARDGGPHVGEPTMRHLAERSGDTVHIDVIDRWGNAISATPSGGWLQSNPVVPGLGAPLNSRAQMFWLEEGLPSSLRPGRRPRTTLTPSMALTPEGRWMAFGTPGGDQQEQWQLAMFLRHVHHGLNLQEAIDAPLFHTAHPQASFYPRGARPGHLLAEPALGDAVLADLRRRGHRLEVSEPWALGRLTAVARDRDGTLSGAATPRLMQAYAVGR